MKSHQKPGPGLVCLALLITIAILMVAGCTGSDPGQQSQVTIAHEKQSEKLVATTIVTMRTMAAQPSSDPVLSTAVITFDPTNDRKAGDQFNITGTTSLPTGTNLFWEIRLDTGTPPTGIDLNSRMGIMANNQVTRGRGNLNRVSLAIDTKDLVPGKYVALAVSLRGNPMTVDPTTGTLAGYTYLTLK
jgi:hypothetical protein